MRKITVKLCILFLFVLLSGCASSGGNNAYLETHDYDDDGRISREEHNKAFVSMDIDGDGHLNDEEIQRGHGGGGRR